jgi:hypothetical protein
MPSKRKSNNNRRRKSTNFPTNGSVAGNTSLVAHLLRAPSDPPAINSAPCFRRTVRQLTTIGAGASLNFNIAGVFTQDNADYGASTNRYAACNLKSVRIFASAQTSSDIPEINVQVNSSDSSQSDAVFRDIGTNVRPAVVAFQFTRKAQETNIPSGNTFVIFVINNLSAVSCRLTIDYDTVFTA